jgi:hypothetical protein
MIIPLSGSFLGLLYMFVEENEKVKNFSLFGGKVGKGGEFGG